MGTYESYRAALSGRRLPLAWCDLDLLDENAAAIAARASGLPVRIATKSVRCRAVLERLLARDGLRGLMCFTAGEAAFLSERGFDDLLVAYPTGSEPEILSVLDRIAAGASITLMVDDTEQIVLLADVAARRGVVLPVCIDIDMSLALPGLHFGVRRSPLRDAPAAVAVARFIREHESLRLDGVMGYEAQVAGLPDAVPGKRAISVAIRALKRRSIAELSQRRGATVTALAREGFSLRFVNGGGTGSLESTREDSSVTELTAGSGFFSPALFDGYRAFRHRPAAGFALPVTRRPARDIYTCHGGGYVASGAAGPDRLPSPYLPDGASLLSAEGAGEVQTPVRYRGPVDLRIGDPVFFRHAKAGELCERFAALVLLSSDSVTTEVPTYRGDGQTFL